MFVYKLTNNISGKVHIGKAINKKCLQQRYRYHKTQKKYYIGRAIQKYGWRNFEREVIDTAQTEEELLKKEQFWIEYYNSTDRSKGCNITEGGESGVMPSDIVKKRVKKIKQTLRNKYGVENPAQIPEAKEKNRQAQLGKRASKETRKLLSEQRKGVLKNFNKEEIERRSKAISGDNNPMAKGKPGYNKRITKHENIQASKILNIPDSQVYSFFVV